MPKAGVDYPATFPQLQRWFPDDGACVDYLARLRWPDGFVCPVCAGGDAWRTGTGSWKCQSCGRKTSVTAGTIFHRSRLPLTTWFAAVWFVTAQKNGVSALGLQRVLGLGSYQTAWSWMHKLRRAMVRPDRDRLGGPGLAVEVDQTFIGGRVPSSRSRYGNKAEVAIAVERRHPRGLGRIRMGLIVQRKIDLVDFTVAAVAPGSVLYTDGEPIFIDAAKQAEAIHEPISLVATGAVPHTVLPAVHRVASLLKRWLAGTMHHGQSLDQLGYYLDEFTFRFNRRDSHSRGLLFHRLLQQAMATNPHPYRELTASHDHNI
jgi:transposase-like protein